MNVWLKTILSAAFMAGAVAFAASGNSTDHSGSSIKEDIAGEIQKIKDCGEPITLEEFVPDDISDEENGASIYREVFDLITERGDISDVTDLNRKPSDEWTEEEIERASSAVEKNRDIYELLQKASRMKCRFLKKKDYEKGFSLTLSHLRDLRQCGRFLVVKAEMEARDGEIDSALDTCLTAFGVARSACGEPILISQLVRVALDGITLSTLENVLKKGEGSESTYQSLIEGIHSEREDDLMYFGLLGERTIFLAIEFPRLKKHAAEKWGQMGEEEREKELKEMLGTRETIRDFGEAFFKTPDTFFDYQQLYYLKGMADIISSSREPYWQAKKKLDNVDKELQELPKEEAMFIQSIAPALSRTQRKETELDAQLGNAEIALACHIYKGKHGVYPSSLKELTPEILSSLPLDPFTGKDYVYRKTDEGFIVYSLGDNMRDDGGKHRKKQEPAGDFDIVWGE